MPKYKTDLLVKINGAAVSADFYTNLNEVVVDTSLGMPSMCSIRIHDDNLTWVDNALLDLGKPLEVSVKLDSDAGNTVVVIFKGEIIALEPMFSAEGRTMMQIRGYDKSHRLHRGRKTRTFLKKTDSEIVQSVAAEAGITVEVDSTSFRHEYVLQYNQTNMEFVISRAERLGYQVIMAEDKLIWKKATYTSAQTPDLVFMENLISFQPRWASTHQSDQMTVRGWDVATKAAIVSTKTPNSALNQGGMTKTGGAAAQTAYAAATEMVVDANVFNQSEGDLLAQGVSDSVSRSFIEAEGIAVGTPQLKAGVKANVTKVGTRFSGSYLITSATHIYRESGFETHFSISGRHPQTLSSLVGGEAVTPEVGKVDGYVTAVVTNLNDPNNLGRVKIKYAWLGDIESDWVRIATPMAGPQRGFMWLPEVNDEVLVAFQHGDIHRPCIVGAVWSNIDKPPVANNVATADGKVNQRVIKTRQGHLIILDDKQGEEKISVKSKSGHQVILDDKSGSENITIKDKTGSNSMVIKSSDNSMAINVNGDFSVTAKGKITLSSTADMSLEAKANTTIKGIQTTVQGTAKAEMKAPNVGVSATAMTEVKGSAMVQIQGGIVKIN